MCLITVITHSIGQEALTMIYVLKFVLTLHGTNLFIKSVLLFADFVTMFLTVTTRQLSEWTLKWRSSVCCQCHSICRCKCDFSPEAPGIDTDIIYIINRLAK